MQQISNKNLTFLLLIAIIVSIAGTIISITRINQLIINIPLITGMANTGTGMVNVTIAGVTSIAATDTQINFGSCSPTTDIGCNATSNLTNSNFNCTCTGGSAPDNITLKNDGNRNINVTVQTNVNASTFIGGSTPYGAEMWFSVRNASSAPGCFNQTGMAAVTGFDNTIGMQWDWRNFTTTDVGYLACANLTFGINKNSLSLFIKLNVPANAPAGAGKNTTLTFTAVNW